MNFQDVCDATIEAVKKAGDLILSFQEDDRKMNISAKSKHNFVTEVDKKSEELLVNELKAILPEAGIIAEEGTGESKGERYNWVIDPIDGTTNFIHGAFPYAVSVALIEDREPVVGVVLELGLQETFHAWRGGGAYLNGKKIHVSNKPDLVSSLVATGFPYTNYSRMNGFMEVIDWFMKNTHGLRRLGSAATDIAWVACGRYDGFFEYGLSPWDVAGGIIILKEAGGKCTDFKGGSNYIFGEEVICSNGHNHDEFVDIIRQIMIEK